MTRRQSGQLAGGERGHCGQIEDFSKLARKFKRYWNCICGFLNKKLRTLAVFYLMMLCMWTLQCSADMCTWNSCSFYQGSYWVFPREFLNAKIRNQCSSERKSKNKRTMENIWYSFYFKQLWIRSSAIWHLNRAVDQPFVRYHTVTFKHLQFCWRFWSSSFKSLTTTVWLRSCTELKCFWCVTLEVSYMVFQPVDFWIRSIVWTGSRHRSECTTQTFWEAAHQQVCNGWEQPIFFLYSVTVAYILWNKVNHERLQFIRDCHAPAY